MVVGWLEFAGGAEGRWRERIGNAVPPKAARAMGEAALEVLDAGAQQLSSAGIWVAPELLRPPIAASTSQPGPAQAQFGGVP